MPWILQYLWLIPAAPLVAAGITALLSQRQRRASAGLSIGALGISLVLSCQALLESLHHSGKPAVSHQAANFNWFELGAGWLQLGWVLDPLSAVMLVMVSGVGLLIFIYSVGYMAHDENFTRFFCFLSLFAGAMLGVVIANSLLLLFICWELVGLASFLLIGFWYHKPSAAAAAKKAFITTRIGDIALLLGMVWLYGESGTLLFYDGGHGCLETAAVSSLAMNFTGLGWAVSTGIALLILVGAMGKSGQVPLHVWLPDAMEGPTPVSALIHAATMVAAGVFLLARVYPIMEAGSSGTALTAVTWVGAVTALFAASIAVAQTDIKRILAYSTVSQLGFMMLGLGVGGVAVGMFHLITHAFFKALLFLGAGSVIHGCHEEQDIRRMGGLRKWMPVTFATYAVGMLALAGFPFLFSGFWSKDGILHAAHGWKGSHWPFYMGVAGALLTAFYMTRQVCFAFFGTYRGAAGAHSTAAASPRESPRVMTVPLVILAVFAVGLGFLGTPAWEGFQAFLGGGEPKLHAARLFEGEVLRLFALSTAIVLAGMGLGWWLYGRVPAGQEPEKIERWWPTVYGALKNKYWVDEAYDFSLVRFNAWCAHTADWVDNALLSAGVQLVSWTAVGLAWISRLCDEFLVNAGFDRGCRGLFDGGGLLALVQNGKIHRYLRILGAGVVLLILVVIWGWRS